MWTGHSRNEFSQEEATVCADACQEVIDVAHATSLTDSYIILKVIPKILFWI